MVAPGPSTFADEPTHPIPQVDVCDVTAVLKNGGATLVFVIASPLRNDLRSRQRLLKKIENYLGYICSDSFAAECGNPCPANTTILVHIHPDSDEGIFQLLEDCRGWISDGKANLEVKRAVGKPT